MDLKNLEEKYKWLKEVDGCLLRTSLEDLDKAYNRFLNKQGGYPKKRKKYYESYRTVCLKHIIKGKEYSNLKIDLKRGTIKLPKLDEIKTSRYSGVTNYPKEIISAIVIRKSTKYYVHLNVKEDIKIARQKPKAFLGIDVGLKNLITCSDGVTFSMNKKIDKKMKRIKGLQKGLSRCEPNSKNRKKIIIKIEREYQKIKNIRRFYIHEITTKLVRENDVITVETLKVQEMIMNGKNHLAGKLSNASFNEIIRQLEYKCRWSGKKFYKVNTYFPSSQICSHCNTRDKKLKNLGIRKWECKTCGNLNDRDLNASINIMNKGIDMYLEEVYK